MRLRFFISTLVLVGCAQNNTDVMKQDRDAVRSELSGEVSLKADREQLAEMRKEIPDEKKKSNDELALYLNLMKQGTEQPENVRNKFTAILEKRRTAFRDKVSKLRDKYRNDETKRRDEFLAEQKRKRDSFNASKHKPEETREYFADQDKARQSFFSEERDRRSNFESELSAQSKDFDSYMREKQNEFTEQYRLYSKAYSDRSKDKKAVKDEEPKYKSIDEVPTQPLGTEN